MAAAAKMDFLSHSKRREIFIRAPSASENGRKRREKRKRRIRKRGKKREWRDEGDGVGSEGVGAKTFLVR